MNVGSTRTTSGIGEGVKVGGTCVGVDVAVGSGVSVGPAVGLGAGVSVGTGDAIAVAVGIYVLVAGTSKVGSGLVIGSNTGGLQALKAIAMSNSSATPVFVIRNPPNLNLLRSASWILVG